MLGRILWILGFAFIVGGPAFGCSMMRVGAPALSDDVRDAKREAVASLERIDGLPRDVIDRFESTSLIPADAREQLSPEQRSQVDAALRGFLATGAGAALRGTAALGLVGVGVVAAYVVGVPMIIVGLWLARRKTVWTCDVCRHVQGASP